MCLCVYWVFDIQRQWNSKGLTVSNDTITCVMQILYNVRCIMQMNAVGNWCQFDHVWYWTDRCSRKVKCSQLVCGSPVCECVCDCTKMLVHQQRHKVWFFGHVTKRDIPQCWGILYNCRDDTKHRKTEINDGSVTPKSIYVDWFKHSLRYWDCV